MTSFLSSSSTRTFLILGLLALCFQSSYAHTYLSSVVLNNGSPLAEGDCVRPHPLGGYDSPIPLVTSPDMTCGWLPSANNPANRKCPIAAGQTISLQWHHQSANPGDDIVDPTHNGPIIVYLAKSDTGAGNVWFKIYEDGFANGAWAVQRLLANGGRVDIPLPSDIAPGNYLLRGELIALHGAYALNGVQPYVGCVELTISGSGTANPSGVAFPGYYTNTDPGMLFNIYQPFSTYVIPGPPKYVSGSSSSGSASSGSNTPAPTNTPKPTTKPPTSPTTKPTATPTSTPTTTPTSAPTSAPPTSPPSNGGASNIKVGLNGGSSAWWVGVVVSGGGETTVKVEMTDSGSVTNWVVLTDQSYAFVYQASSVLKAPLSLRLTSSTGKQVTLPNVITSLTATNSLIDSGKSYSGSSGTSAPTTKPTTAPTSAPTSAPTTKPTTPPSSGSNAKITVYEGSTEWWFAVTVSGTTESISKIELKDAGTRTTYQPLTNQGWAYTFTTGGVALVTPLTVKVTTASGKVTFSTLRSITPGSTLDTTTSQ